MAPLREPPRSAPVPGVSVRTGSGRRDSLLFRDSFLCRDWLRCHPLAWRCAWIVLLLLPVSLLMRGQASRPAEHAAPQPAAAQARAAAVRRRASNFLRGRTSLAAVPAAAGEPAESLVRARTQHVALSERQAISLNAPWTAVGPLQVQTSTYGLVTGRVTAAAIDPSDTTGNTVYLGTSGGGVWKSTNAAGAAASVGFAPLTDTLPAFSPNAGGSVVPSLSIGAISVQPGGTGVVLAGTGDPNDASDSYYGSGLLRSTDSGATWSLVTGGSGGSFVGEGFAGFAWSTVSQQVVVAAVSSSAESVIVGGSRSPGVRGLYYSLDGGSTWTVATVQDGSSTVQSAYSDYGSFRGNAATSVVWNPLRKKFYAAVRAHGYYASSDGMTWTRLAAQPGSGLTAANCPTRAGTYGLAGCPIFRGALAAQPVSGDLFALTVDSSNGSGGLWQDVCSPSGSACASATERWGTKLDSTAMEDSGKIAGGDYSLVLAAIPAATALAVNDTLLFAGTTDLFRCGLYGGCTLRNTTNTMNGCAAPAGVAPAQHAIAWQASTTDTSRPAIFFGNDGGLWRSLDGVRQQAAVCSADDATHFDNLNGALGSLAEVAGFSSHPTDPNVLLASLGANGSAASTTASQAGSQAAWTQLSSGESDTVAIDQSNGGSWLVQSGQGISLHTCTSGSACTPADFVGVANLGSAQVQGDASAVDAPAILDPALNTNVIAGTCRVFRGPASGGSTWSAANALSRFLAGPSGTACNSTNALIRSLAAGGSAVLTAASQNSGSPVLYAGLAGVSDGGSTFGGHLYVTTSANTANSSTTWRDAAAGSVTNGNGAGFNAGGFDISSIAVDPSDTSGRTVYATVMGFGYPHVYRSTDAGTTWLNISSNLPDAPANSVAVDPGDPRIVYVAMDTGVYATSDVTTCVNSATGATGSCWGVLGSNLPNAPAVLLVASKGIAVNSSNGVLRVGTYGRGIWQLALLSTGQSLQPAATFAPASLVFAAQDVGSSSAAQSVTLTNTGNTVLGITTVAAGTGFAETDTCAGASLTVGATCSLSVAFTPSATGAITGTVDVHGTMSGGYASLPVSGTGRGVSNLVLSPGAVSFPATAVGRTSAPQTITLTNTGTGSAALTGQAASTDFGVASTTCGSSLAPGGACAVNVTFTPSQNGPEIGTLSVTDSTGTRTSGLSGLGTGSANVSLSPSSPVDFGGFPVNGYRGVAVVTVSNSGNAAATLGPPITDNDFAVYRNDCNSLLAAGQSCTVVLTFGATAPGPRSGTFTIADESSLHTLALTGTGNATTVDFSPPSLTFGTVSVGSASSMQRVTVTNRGATPLLWSVLTAAGDFSIGENSCVDPLAIDAACSFTVSFVPTLNGPRYGTISLTDQYATHTVSLTGTGRGAASIGVSPVSISFGTVAVFDTSSAQTVTVTNSGTATATLGLPVVSGVDFKAASTTCGAVLAPQAACTVTLIFTPGSDGPRAGTLAIAAMGGTQTVALSGNATGTPIVTITPAALVFGSTVLHGTSAALTLTVKNGGNAPAIPGKPTIAGDFALTGNTCTGSLVPGGTCLLTVTFTPTAVGVRNGLLTMPDALANHTVTLTGTGTTGTLSLSSTSLTFPDTALSVTSPARTVAVTNVGAASLNVSSLTTTGDYAATGTCSGALGAGQSCSVSVTFTPTAAGARPGTLSIASDSGGSSSTVTVALHGNGKSDFNIVLTPVAVDFGTQPAGTVSALRNITVSNNGIMQGALGSIGVSGDFSLKANTCGTSLAPQTGCTVSVVFVPTGGGRRDGVLTVVDDAGTQTASLTGTGTAAATDALSPLVLSFAAQQVNTVSSAATVTLTNSGDTALTLISAQVLTGDFTAANGCGPTLPAQSSCDVRVFFAPKSVGPQSGTLLVTDVQRNQTVTLSGTGQAGPGLSLSPSNVAFTATGVGVSTAGQTLTLTNNGSVAISLTDVSVTGDFGIVNGSSTCALGSAIPVGSACSLQIAFFPTVSGARTGSLTIGSNGPVQVAQLSGTGVDFQFTANGSTTATVSTGGNAVFPLLLRPAVNTSDPVTFTCTGAPANAKCTITSQYGDLSATQTVSLTILTGTTSPSISLAAFLLPLLALLPLGKRGAWLCLVLVALCAAGGCGSGRHTALPGDGTSSPGGGSGSGPGTPSGTYTITASATAAGVTHTVPLTLVVK